MDCILRITPHGTAPAAGMLHMVHGLKVIILQVNKKTPIFLTVYQNTTNILFTKYQFSLLKTFSFIRTLTK